MDNKQENKDGEQLRLYINGCAFIQLSGGKDYILYQAPEPRTLGDIKADLFLEHVPDKGWWGGLRLNGRFRIQLKLAARTLFPIPEIALQATEEFLADEHNVRKVLEAMRERKQDLQTFSYVPPRSVDVDPENYFSPDLLEVDGTIFTLYHLTQTEAVYRSWERRQVVGIEATLKLGHSYGQGWQSVLHFSGARSVIFEPAVDQLFLTPEHALKTLLVFCKEEEHVRNLVQQLKQLGPEDNIFIRHYGEALMTAKLPLLINKIDFVWQKQISEGQLYQAKRATLVNFNKVYIQLIETWHKGWLAGVQFRDVSGIYFEKDENVGFSTPEEALAAAQRFIALKTEGWKILYHAHNQRLALQCRTGRYDRLISISIS
ncbi:hypothetical protein [Dictyobacter kobayashii]|uniref:Uncharacterized protein n=1 Tax=Dictyobacter kobayashii TaxID=2014872 RepID=A0A402ANH7_9CHLR|nr:hypothetical protein [Dictyobacter kobayashii]GCE20584.1 hypothetical protein KDK_43840 [Dictyobacter kobayashii]